MAEVRLEVEVAHPPERVWRALTDARLVSEWFMSTDLEPLVGGRFTLHPSGHGGFLGPVFGELTELMPAHRMVMLWQGEKLHTRVVWELAEVAGGCQVRMVQTGFIGAPATIRRRALRATYTRALAEQLPGVLDRLAAGETDPADEGEAALRTAVPRQRQAAITATVGAPPAAGPVELNAEDAFQSRRAVDGVESPPRSLPDSPSFPEGQSFPEDPAPPAGPRPFRDSVRAVASVPAPRGRAGSVGGRVATVRPAPGEDDAADQGGRWRRVGGRLAPWRRRLAGVPGWVRALAIAGAAAVLAVAVLAGVSQTSAPPVGPDGRPGGGGDGRAAPGIGVQPDPAVPPASGADGPDDSAGAGPGDAPGDSPGGAGDQAPGDAPAAPGDPVPGAPGGGPEGAEPSEGTTASGDPPPPAPELAATMSTSNRLLGLQGRAVSVTVSNSGPGEAGSWQVTMDVGDQSVTNVSGAAQTQDGSLAIFTPVDGALAAGDSTVFTFDIPGGGALGLGGAEDPTGCTIDGHPCD